MTFKIKYDKNGSPLPMDKQPDMEKVIQQTQSVSNVDNQSTVENPVVDILATTEESIQSQTNADLLQKEDAAQVQTNEDPKEKNWKEIRQRALKAERERNELLNLIKQQQQIQQPQKQAEEDLEVNLAPDDLAEGKHLAKFAKKQNKLAHEFQQYKAELENKLTEQRIRNDLPDFDKVVSQENLEMLKESFPAIANTIMSSPDLYNKAHSAYQIIKKLGINYEDSIEMDKNKIKQNMEKPKSVIAAHVSQGRTPLDQANPFAQGLTKELRASLRKEMESARKNY